MRIEHILPFLSLLAIPFRPCLAQAPQGGFALITDASQLSSPYADSVEGTEIGHLIDGDPASFWHTDWHGLTQGDEHWVEVELTRPVTGLVALYMHRRNAENDHPIKMRVSGSADGSVWTELAMAALPYGGYSGVMSEPWPIREPMSRIRLAATDCQGNGAGFRTFWHAAEIQLYHISEEFEYSNTIEGLRINEVQVANIDQYVDKSFNYGGWIELYNPTGALCAAEGAVLRHTNAQGEMREAVLGLTHGLFPPGGYVCLGFDHHCSDGIYGGESHKQIPFKMDPEGGRLELVAADGTVADALDYPPAVARCSYARKEDGGEGWGWTAEPTPEASNQSSTFAVGRLAAPQVSRESTLFEKSVSFKVDIPEGCTLVYTTDGSAPTRTHGLTTTNGSFTTLTTKVYRFVLLAPGKLPSPVVTRSFIKDEAGLKLPVLQISSHPDNFFDPVIGVYVRGTNGVADKGQSIPCNWNMDWERPANVEYLVPGPEGYECAINQEAEFKVAGGWSRAYGGGNGWEMKSSFRLKSGKVYEGKNSFDYPFFAGPKAFNKYKTLQVRNGGNDTYARIKDPIIHEIFSRSGYYMDVQAWQPCHVFLNGRYLGMLNIRENNNRYYAQGAYGIDEDNVDQFELGASGFMQNEGTSEAFDRLLGLSKRLSASPKDEALWQEICQLLDVDEYCNYMAAECYVGSNDWMTNNNNVKGFRSREDGGKFHLVMFDIDQAFYDRNMIGSLRTLLAGYDGRYSANGGKNVLAELFFNLLAYEPFKRQFVHAFCLVDGSVMAPERCKAIIDEMVEITAPALALEGNSPIESAKWIYGRINSAQEREQRMTNMQQQLNPGTPMQLDIESNIPQARILVDGQEIPTRQFKGMLFPPFTLTTAAPAGWVFQGWEVVKNAAQQQQVFPFQGTWQYYDQGSQDDADWKSPEALPAGWRTARAPFGYGPVGSTAAAADYNITLSYGEAPGKPTTCYFRHLFTLDQAPGAGDRFFLYYQVDDGALFYLNGVEVGAHNCRSGSKYADSATGSEGNVAARGTIQIPAHLVRQGRNVLAAQVHNASVSDNDIFFDARMVMATFDSQTLSTKPQIVFSASQQNASYKLCAMYRPIDTPARKWQDGASPIRINEVSAGNDIHVNDYFKKNDWVELYNTTGSDIDVAGMYLSDDRRNPQKYQISSRGSQAGTIVPAHGFLTVWCDNLTPLTQLHAPFKLDNADGAVVSIQAEDGTWADEMAYSAQDRWKTYGRYPDGGHLCATLSRPTIASPNMMCTQDFAQSYQPVPASNTEMAITLALGEGWNWTSHNLAQAVHASRFTSYARRMESQADSLVVGPEGEWTGGLGTMEAAAGYKLCMHTAADIVLRGQLYDVAAPVSLRQGWNWTGFPLHNPTTLQAALLHYTPTEGDAIVGMEGFSTYEDGQWEGTLTSLHPGQAYLLRAGMAQQFCWNALSQPASKVRRYAAPRARIPADAPWTPAHNAHPNVCSVIATLEIGGQPAQADNFFLGAFSDGQCRGVAEWIDGRLYLNIHGTDREEIQFQLMDSEGKLFKAHQTLTFSPQSIVGSRQSPLRLTIGSTAIHTPTSAGSPVVGTEYYLLDGRRISVPQDRGVYLKKDTHQNGHTSTVKIRL